MPVEGSITRSGWLMRMPSTSASPLPSGRPLRCGRLCGARLRGRRASPASPSPRLFTSATSTGCSRVMLRAGLSSRRPWKTEWRIRPSGVHSPNETSATSVGRTQWPPASRGFSKNGGRVARPGASSASAQRRAATRLVEAGADVAGEAQLARLVVDAEQQRADPGARALADRSSRRPRTPGAACT